MKSLRAKKSARVVCDKNGFSLIEILFAVSVVAIILTALMGAMLFTVNTLSESKYRANAIAWASSCIDEFKKARALGWVQFAQGDYLNVTCDGATLTGGTTRTIATEGGGSGAGGNYCLRMQADASNRTGLNGHIKVTVRVAWEHFNSQITCDNSFDTGDKNRTATVEEIFYRYNDEQPI